MRLYWSSTAVERSMRVPMAYWLFSHTNSTGSFHTEAMFMVSWNVPWLLAPSPRKQMAIWSVFLCLQASASPAAAGPPRLLPRKRWKAPADLVLHVSLEAAFLEAAEENHFA